jgi:hypothetical protein
LRRLCCWKSGQRVLWSARRRASQQRIGWRLRETKRRLQDRFGASVLRGGVKNRGSCHTVGRKEARRPPLDFLFADLEFCSFWALRDLRAFWEPNQVTLESLRNERLQGTENLSAKRLKNQSGDLPLIARTYGPRSRPTDPNKSSKMDRVLYCWLGGFTVRLRAT